MRFPRCSGSASGSARSCLQSPKRRTGQQRLCASLHDNALGRLDVHLTACALGGRLATSLLVAMLRSLILKPVLLLRLCVILFIVAQRLEAVQYSQRVQEARPGGARRFAAEVM